MLRWEVISKLLKEPILGAEIGVKEGKFTSYLLSQHPELTMFCIDPWTSQPNGNETYGEWNFDEIYSQYKNRIKPYKDRVIELRGFSKTAVMMVEDKSLDFVFIDAQHDYDSVKQDIDLWLPKVKKGGLLSGHDYHEQFPGVIKAVNEFFTPEIGDNDVWYMYCV